MIPEPLQVSSALAGEGSIDIGAILGGTGLSGIFTLIIGVISVFSAIMIGRDRAESSRNNLNGKRGSYFAAIPDDHDRGSELLGFLILISLIMVYHRTYDYFALSLAVPGVITIAGRLSEKGKRIFLMSFALLIGYTFFGLRIFHESKPSLVALGVLYYGFTFVYGYLMLTLQNRSGTAAK